MNWYQDEEEEEEDLMFSPALLARRGSESWLVEVDINMTFLSNLNTKIYVLLKCCSEIA